ncbi:MAG: hypothetical protein FD143_3740, partial [Ignavibacteria bacterium]
ELKSVFDFRKEEKVLIEIPFQFIYSNNFEVWMQFEPIQIYTATSKILLLEAGVDNRRKDKLFRAIEPQEFVQPGEFKPFIADPDVARYYQRFSTGNKGICPQEEDLTFEVVSSVVWTKHAHLDAANGVCSGSCRDMGRQSPYEKVSIMALTASIERPGDDWFTREIIWFHPSPECKARVEFYDPAKRRKAYFHSFTLSAPPYSGF